MEANFSMRCICRVFTRSILLHPLNASITLRTLFVACTYTSDNVKISDAWHNGTEKMS